MPLNAAAAVGKPPSARSGHTCTALPAHLAARLSPSGAEDGADAEGRAEGLLACGPVETKPDLAGQSRPSGWLAEAGRSLGLPEACSGAERSLRRARRPTAEPVCFRHAYTYYRSSVGSVARATAST